MGDVYTNPPQSRNEAILNSIVEGTQYTDPPQSRIEDLLLEVKQVIEEGGHDESATRASIAPTESDSAHASKNIAVGEQFYLSDDKLYTATSPISQGSAIIVYPTSGYNCKLSDSVTGQIKAVKDGLGTASTKNSTSVVTDSSDLVESGAVKDAIVGTTGWIGGNLLIFPYDAQTTTYAWGTVTVNGDGSITVNGTTTERTAIKLETPAMNYDLPNRSYILSLENAQSGTALLLEGYNGVTWAKLIGSANVSNPSVSVSIDHNGYTNLSVYISIESGTTLNNVTFKPMISKRGGLFVPYHPSVEESKCDNSVIAPVENGPTASQAYAVGEHFIKDGQFKEVTQAIASGGAISDSNTVDKPIADLLTPKYQSITKNGLSIGAGKYGKLVIITISNGTCTDPVSANDSLVNLSDFSSLFTANDKFLIPFDALETYGKTLRIWGASNESSVKVRDNVSAGAVIRVTIVALLM